MEKETRPSGCKGEPVTAAKLDLIKVVETNDKAGNDSECYTKASLRTVLQLMGCKTRVAHKAAKLVFQDLAVASEHDNQHDPDVGRRREMTLTRPAFSRALISAVQTLTEKLPDALHLKLACQIQEQRQCIIILLAGTSGTGKSTLASLLAAKLGITNVTSTDSIRHMIRSFTCEEENPLLFASTYQAGDLLPAKSGFATSAHSYSRNRAVQGYKAQCESILEKVQRLVAGCAARNESMIMEGVHLSINAVMRIMAHHPCVLPFLIHIANEAKHKERFAVRAKYMTLEPGANRYIKHIQQIRVIQDYLVKRADRHCIPRVNNTNVDRSVAALHATVLSVLKRQAKGEVILDAGRKTAKPLAEDYEHCKRDTWSGKSMLQLIRSRKSASAKVLDGRGSGREALNGPIEALHPTCSQEMELQRASDSYTLQRRSTEIGSVIETENADVDTETLDIELGIDEQGSPPAHVA